MPLLVIRYTSQLAALDNFPVELTVFEEQTPEPLLVLVDFRAHQLVVALVLGVVEGGVAGVVEVILVCDGGHLRKCLMDRAFGGRWDLFLHEVGVGSVAGLWAGWPLRG